MYLLGATLLTLKLTSSRPLQMSSLIGGSVVLSAWDSMTARSEFYSKHTHTHTFNGHFPGLPRWASTRKVKPIWVLLKQETVSGSGISWTVCKSAPHHSVFLQAGCPSCHLTNSIEALKANRSAPQNHTIIAGAWFYCPHAVADCNWHTRIVQKLLEFLSAVSSTPPYHVTQDHTGTYTWV